MAVRQREMRLCVVLEGIERRVLKRPMERLTDEGLVRLAQGQNGDSMRFAELE